MARVVSAFRVHIPLPAIVILLTIAALGTLASAQPAPPAPAPDALPADATRPAIPALSVRAGVAYSWAEGDVSILLLEEGAEITAGEATLGAESAVLWMTKVPGEARTRVDVVLIGRAQLVTPDVRRSGPVLAVDLVTSGAVRLDVPPERRVARDRSDTAVFRQALELRPERPEPPEPQPPDPREPVEPPQPPGVVEEPPPGEQEHFAPPLAVSAGSLRTIPTSDGTLAIEATGHVFMMQRTEDDDLLELRADRAVVFTTLTRLDDVGALDPEQLGGVVTGAYLEGDVRVVFTPARGRARDEFLGNEQRLEASRAYYDFLTEQAMLSEAVLHTQEPGIQLPLTVRAEVVRQLAAGHYEATRAQISTSRMVTPDYSLNARRIFVRTAPLEPERTVAGGRDLNVRVMGVPVFYLPVVQVASDMRLPIRAIRLGQDSVFGAHIETRWGIWETIGRTPPQAIDATYNLNYYHLRGPGGGLDAAYFGDFVTGHAAATNFRGNFTSFLVHDTGRDRLGGRRANIEQDGFRGRAYWEHLQFLPDGYTATARLGYASDPTFIEQWEREQFLDGLPHDAFLMLERADSDERIAITAAAQPQDFFTTAELAQEGLYVERLPELTYDRYGTAIGPVTLRSLNRAGALRFDVHDVDYFADLGFRDFAGTPDFDESFPGIPSIGYTGAEETVVGRGDFRQELAVPFDAGVWRITPWVLGRATAWSETPDGPADARIIGGGGIRLNTAMVRTDAGVYSRLLDVDGLRHVVEPGVELFAAASSRSREEVFIFDEDVDAVDAVTALRLMLNQRWQTHRGGPGRRRSVDLVTLNVELLLFGEGPREVVAETAAGPVDAGAFRGRYFQAMPEASITRDSINADLVWRITDTTAFLGDASWSIDEGNLATVAAGLTAVRGDRVRYTIGARHVEPLDLTLAIATFEYRLSQRYSFVAATSYDFNEGDFRRFNVWLTRSYEKVAVNFGAFYDAVDDVSGFRFNLYPTDLPRIARLTDQFVRQ